MEYRSLIIVAYNEFMFCLQEEMVARQQRDWNENDSSYKEQISRHVKVSYFLIFDMYLFNVVYISIFKNVHAVSLTLIS